MGFEGKKVWVTGGAQGIGKAIVKSFLEKGAHVAFCDIDAVAGQETGQELSALPGKLHFFQSDVANSQQTLQFAQLALNALGGVDILVNNVGIGAGNGDFLAEWNRVFTVNVTAAMLLSKECANHMPFGSAIVNIVSTRALMSEANTFAYSASKGALLSLTHAMAVTYGPNVRVNSICPGWIETAQWKRQDQRYTPKHSAQDEAQHPAGRVGIPQDIAHAVLFLCQEENGFITGSNLVIDGGMTIKMIYQP